MLRKLFRGILDILHANYDTTRSRLNQHIRTFDKPSQKSSTDMEAVSGFWRMVFELVLNLYLVFTLSLGILLSFAIVLIVWPFSLCVIAYTSILNHESNQPPRQTVEPVLEPIPNDNPIKESKDANSKK
jgi:hypothetical protein